MSEFIVEVVRVGAITKHPNADALSLTKVVDYPVILRTGDFKEGDLAVYVPVDAIVPDEPRWAFLGGHNRIRARKLRGIFSMGLLVPLPTKEDLDLRSKQLGFTLDYNDWRPGDDAAQALGVTKFIPPEPAGGDEKDPGLMVVYDIEGLRRHPNLFTLGEEVIVTEKIEGENTRIVHDGDRLWVGSGTRIKAKGGALWWQAAERQDLEATLKSIPNIALYGELHGHVGGFDYGLKVPRITFFDSLLVKERRWLDTDEFLDLVRKLGLPHVPILYRGPWEESIRTLAEGKTTFPGANHIREGIVVKPVKERQDLSIGRVILKLQGEGYLTS